VSQPSYVNQPGGVVVQKPKWDVYTTMLGLSCVAIVIAITLLALEMRRYNFDLHANSGKVQRTSRAAPVEAEVRVAAVAEGASWR
jgi:hypothetical protein